MLATLPCSSNPSSDTSDEMASFAQRSLEFDELFANTAPLGFAGGDTNLYRYVGNEPINLIDSDGLAEHLPSDSRGKWIEGTKGNGVFEYGDTKINQQHKMVGKKVRFANNHIAIGGFPAEYYYSGNAAKASVTIDDVKGTDADFTAADKKMRQKLKNPNWQRPTGYLWNHAGEPGSKVMELVDKSFHERVHHQGNAKVVRADLRASQATAKANHVESANTSGSRSGRMVARSLVLFDAYLTMRDAAQAAGVINPDYEIRGKFDYYYASEEDNSVFVVEVPGGLIGCFLLPQRRFVAGDRTGEIEYISHQEVDSYRTAGEAIWGKYIEGGWFHGPRFIPGTERKSIPFTTTDEHGIEYDAGWIDEDGIHYSGIPRALPI